MSVTIPLTQPITAHGDELYLLELREPTTKDVRSLGYPYVLVNTASGSGGIEFLANVVANYIVLLGKIPMSSVDQLTLADFTRAQGVVQGFFKMGDDEASSS